MPGVKLRRWRWLGQQEPGRARGGGGNGPSALVSQRSDLRIPGMSSECWAGHVPWIMGLLARGAIAQLGERLLCKQEVAGSIPAGSIGFFSLGTGMGRRAGPQEPELAKSLSQATRSIPQLKPCSSRCSASSRTASPASGRSPYFLNGLPTGRSGPRTPPPPLSPSLVVERP
jgi:hypothetical protein